MVASRKIADARPTPNSLKVRSFSRRKLPKTNTMMAAAAVITRAVVARPLATDGVAVAGAVVLLLDPGEEEHLVVHREAEHDGEEHHRRERLDGPGLQPGDVAEPAPLHDGDGDAVGGADRQQVHDHGLQRHEQRSEHHHHQQERHQQHRQEEVRHPRAEEVGEVDRGGHLSR